MCDVWGENEKETKGNSPEDGQFQFRVPLNGGKERRGKRKGCEISRREFHDP